MANPNPKNLARMRLSTPQLRAIFAATQVEAIADPTVSSSTAEELPGAPPGTNDAGTTMEPETKGSSQAPSPVRKRRVYSRKGKSMSMLFKKPPSGFPLVAKDFEVECFLCSKSPSGSSIYEHMFFGNLMCMDCGLVARTCMQFAVLRNSKELCPLSERSHRLNHWADCPVAFLSDSVQKSLSRQEEDSVPSSATVAKEMARYLKELSVLKFYKPWKSAFAKCQEYIKTAINDIDEPGSNRNAEPNALDVERIKYRILYTSNQSNDVEMTKSTTEGNATEKSEMLLTTSIRIKKPPIIVDVVQDKPMTCHRPDIPKANREDLDVPKANREDLPDVPEADREDLLDVPKANREDLLDVPKANREDLLDVPKANREDLPDVPKADREDLPDVPKANREDLLDVPKANREDLPDVPKADREDLPDVPKADREDLLDVPKADREDHPDVPKADREDLPDVPEANREDQPVVKFFLPEEILQAVGIGISQMSRIHQHDREVQPEASVKSKKTTLQDVPEADREDQPGTSVKSKKTPLLDTPENMDQQDASIGREESPLPENMDQHEASIGTEESPLPESPENMDQQEAVIGTEESPLPESPENMDQQEVAIGTEESPLPESPENMDQLEAAIGREESPLPCIPEADSEDQRGTSVKRKSSSLRDLPAAIMLNKSETSICREESPLPDVPDAIREDQSELSAMTDESSLPDILGYDEESLPDIPEGKIDQREASVWRGQSPLQDSEESSHADILGYEAESLPEIPQCHMGQREASIGGEESPLPDVPEVDSEDQPGTSVKREMSPLRDLPASVLDHPNLLKSNHLEYMYPKQRPPEECPRCNHVLCATIFTVNVVTFTASARCPGCSIRIDIKQGSSAKTKRKRRRRRSLIMKKYAKRKRIG